jgi:hypothetical protein
MSDHKTYTVDITLIMDGKDCCDVKRKIDEHFTKHNLNELTEYYNIDKPKFKWDHG